MKSTNITSLFMKNDSNGCKKNGTECKYIDKPAVIIKENILEKKIVEDIEHAHRKLDRCMENQFYYMVINNVSSVFVALVFYCL
jgi:hypothetical protein